MIEKYKALCSDLQGVLQSTFPNCVVHPFGSTVTGLASTTSDVDAYVQVFTVNENIDLHNTNVASLFVVKSKKILQKYRNVFTQLRAIPKAKTPILRCVHIPTGISCDFNFKNMLGVCNSFLVRYYLSLDTKLKVLMIIIRHWAKSHELSGGSSQFSNYSLVLLFIFYLQQQPYFLPSVVVLQISPISCNMQGGWNGGFHPVRNFVSNSLASLTISHVLCDFFEYYSNFDFSLNVISVFLGRAIPKTDFLKPTLLPNSFHIYKENIKTQYHLKVETPICLQDPFEHNHNVTNSIRPKQLDEFIEHCKIAVNIFKSEPLNSDALYQLFTEESDSINIEKYTITESVCQFKIAIDKYLYYLNLINTNSKQILIDSEKNLIEIRSTWYKIVNEFIMIFLTKIMKFTVELKTDLTDAKTQRLNGQSDVHDTNIIDSVHFHCIGYHNLWDARKSMQRDMHIDESLTLVDKQIYLSNYMYDLFKFTNTTNVMIEFNMSVEATINPIEMHFNLNKLNCRKGCFKSFELFIVKAIPSWLKTHIFDLTKNTLNTVEEVQTEET